MKRIRILVLSLAVLFLMVCLVGNVSVSKPLLKNTTSNQIKTENKCGLIVKLYKLFMGPSQVDSILDYLLKHGECINTVFEEEVYATDLVVDSPARADVSSACSNPLSVLYNLNFKGE